MYLSQYSKSTSLPNLASEIINKESEAYDFAIGSTTN